MGLTTTATPGQLKRTERACARCGETAAALAGRADHMVCSTCEEIEFAERAARLALHGEAEARAKGAQDEERAG